MQELTDLLSDPGGHEPDGTGPDEGSPLEGKLPDQGAKQTQCSAYPEQPYLRSRLNCACHPLSHATLALTTPGAVRSQAKVNACFHRAVSRKLGEARSAVGVVTQVATLYNLSAGHQSLKLAAHG